MQSMRHMWLLTTGFVELDCYMWDLKGDVAGDFADVTTPATTSTSQLLVIDIVNSQKGDPRTPKGLYSTLNSQRRDPSTRRGLGPPAALFYLSHSDYFSCIPVCHSSDCTSVVLPCKSAQSLWNGIDGWSLSVESKLSSSRRVLLFC